MSKSLLWALAALCNFISAAITYYDSGRFLIVIMQLFAGLLMIIAAIKYRQKH
ncbi:MAG TPA: hypothetical protein VF544_05050 [Pyrinomonadaceae bacterium]